MGDSSNDDVPVAAGSFANFGLDVKDSQVAPVYSQIFIHRLPHTSTLVSSYHLFTHGVAHQAPVQSRAVPRSCTTRVPGGKFPDVSPPVPVRIGPSSPPGIWSVVAGTRVLELFFVYLRCGMPYHA